MSPIFFSIFGWILYALLLDKFVNNYKSTNMKTIKIGNSYLKHLLRDTSTNELFFLYKQLFSLTHAVIALSWSGILLLRLFIYDGDIFSLETPTTSEYNLCVFSFGYFFTDTFFSILGQRNKEFILHHVMSCLLLLSVYISENGRGLVLIGLFIGELTNPLMKIWTILKHSKSPLFHKINVIYSPFYVIVRGLVLPWGIYYIQREIYYDISVSIWTKMYWTLFNIILQAGSWVWCYKVINGFIKYSNKIKGK